MKKLLITILVLALLTGCTAKTDVVSETTAIKTTTTSTTETKPIETTVDSTTSNETITSETTSTPEIKIADSLPADAIEQVEFEDIELLQFEYDYIPIIYDETEFNNPQLVDKAYDTFIESNYYTEFITGIEKSKADLTDEFYEIYYSDWLDNGNFILKFLCGVTEDFDGNGTLESFIIFRMPDYEWPMSYKDYVVFINSDGNAEVIAYGNCIGEDGISLIDYGSFKHLDIQYGHNNSTTKYEILSVIGDSTQLEMRDCYRGEAFLGNRLQYHIAIQQCCGMATFWDNKDKCYKQLGGVDYDLDTFKEYLHTDENSSKFLFNRIMNVKVFGNKYYVINTENTFNYGFTYENGNFDFEDKFNLANTDGEYVSYNLDCYVENDTPIPPVAYIDLSKYDE